MYIFFHLEIFLFEWSCYKAELTDPDEVGAEVGVVEVRDGAEEGVGGVVGGVEAGRVVDELPVINENVTINPVSALSTGV